METWRFRIMVATALTIVLFGDFLGLGLGKDRKLQVARQSPTLRDEHPSIYLDDEESSNGGGILSFGPDDIALSAKPANGPPQQQQQQQQSAGVGATNDSSDEVPPRTLKLTDELRDACLPKMLCEMAAKSPLQQSDKERHLLSLIRSTTLSQSGQNTKWHFAAHMGHLMRDSADPSGCAHLWPQCPYTSKRLNRLTVRFGQ